MNFEQFRLAIDAETTRLATLVGTLIAKANTPAGLTPEEEAQADALVAHLKAIGADAAAPIPPSPLLP